MEVGKTNNGEPIFNTTDLRYSGKQIRETFDRSFEVGIEEGKRLFKEELTKWLKHIEKYDPEVYIRTVIDKMNLL